MKTIGLLYLNETNLGDIIIYDTTKYLTIKACKKNNIDANIVSFDIGLNTPKSYELTSSEKLVKDRNEKFIKRFKKFQKFSKSLKKTIIRKKWQTTKYYFYLKSNILPNIKNVDMLIFVGGGIIKYKQQEFLYIIDEITKVADKNNIPVIFNSVGIEDYDKANLKCMLLKKAINRKCVKAISTRDNIDLLQGKYIVNKKIYTTLAADPALYSSECYNIKKKNSNIIGIGLIRPNIFKEYMYDINEEFLLKLYKDLIDEIIRRGYQAKVFINGTNADYKIQNKLKEYLGDDKKYSSIFVSKPTNSKELVNIISSFKGTIASRLHASIVSYALGIPSIGLVWNKKQLMFGKIIDKENNFLTKEQFDSKYILDTLENNFNNENVISPIYKKTVYNFLNMTIKSILK